MLTTNAALHSLLRLLDSHGVTGDPAASITLSEPAGIIAKASMAAIASDTTDIPWDMDLLAGALGRWLLDAVLVVVMGVAVFTWKRSRVQQRKMLQQG